MEEERMHTTVKVACPQELLIGLHTNVEAFGEFMKLSAAISLFKDGKLSSGMAAKWLNMPRTTFLLKAMDGGAELLDDSQDDFERETSLL
jgi:hypothetical protein